MYQTSIKGAIFNKTYTVLINIIITGTGREKEEGGGVNHKGIVKKHLYFCDTYFFVLW